MEGAPSDLVPIQFRCPLWLKKQVLEDAAAGAQDLSEWMREAVREKLASKGKKSRRAPAEPEGGGQ